MKSLHGHRAHWCNGIGVKEGIHSSNEQIIGFYTPAGIRIVRERDKKECKRREGCGKYDHHACSKEKQPVLSARTLGTFL